MLEGVIVLDLTTLLPGPHATSRLAEMGATIWKVEPPGGDPARYTHPLEDDLGLVFKFHSRGKTLYNLNLKDSGDRGQFLQLVRQADVLIEGFRPEVVERLNIDYRRLREINPALIYCALTGYGQQGEWANHAGHDINYLALSGMLSQHIDPNGRPILPTVQWADLVGAETAAQQILGALVARGKTGRGQFLDISMMHALRQLLAMHDAIEANCGFDRGVPDISGMTVSYHLYPTQDQRWVALGALEPKFWAVFCDAISHPEWKEQHMSTAQKDNPVYTELSRLFSSHPLSYWTNFSRRVDCCLAPVLTLSESQDRSSSASKEETSHGSCHN